MAATFSAERFASPDFCVPKEGETISYCPTVVTEAEVYLGYAWIGFTVLAFALVLWAMIRPQKPSHLQGREVGEG